MSYCNHIWNSWQGQTCFVTAAGCRGILYINVCLPHVEFKHSHILYKLFTAASACNAFFVAFLRDNCLKREKNRSDFNERTKPIENMTPPPSLPPRL